jgi:hypothetical protein
MLWYLCLFSGKPADAKVPTKKKRLSQSRAGDAQPHQQGPVIGGMVGWLAGRTFYKENMS